MRTTFDRHSTSINFRHRICKNLKIMAKVYQLEGGKNWREKLVTEASIGISVSSFRTSFTADIGNFNRRSRFHWAPRFSIFWQCAIVVENLENGCPFETSTDVNSFVIVELQLREVSFNFVSKTNFSSYLRCEDITIELTSELINVKY